MKLFYTTDDFVYKGHRYAGVPFLCTNDMEIVKAPSDYLTWVALENARTPSRSTWRGYGETLCDYFSWLEANSLRWDAIPTCSSELDEVSNIALYRKWSLELRHEGSDRRAIQTSTVRKRLYQIIYFYEWAVSRKRLDRLPWNVLRPVGQDLSLNSDIPRTMMPSVPRRPIRLLSIEQCGKLVSACNNSTLRMMTALMLQTGIRNEECRTFPSKYLFDPSPARRSQRISVDLSPSDMMIKNNRPRRVYIAGRLMKDMFDYANFGEGAQRAKNYRLINGAPSPYVFLNRYGDPWSETGLCNAYAKLCKTQGSPAILDFKVTPHMLRHTFATFELYAESQNRNLGFALAWVRDRLGHSSVQTTTMYVHCLDLLGEPYLNQYQAEIDALLGNEVRYEAKGLPKSDSFDRKNRASIR